jgi:peroxiredoxin
MVGDTAPDFSLPDYNGRLYTLSELTARKSALLVFNIGLA